MSAPRRRIIVVNYSAHRKNSWALAFAGAVAAETVFYQLQGIGGSLGVRRFGWSRSINITAVYVAGEVSEDKMNWLAEKLLGYPFPPYDTSYDSKAWVVDILRMLQTQTEARVTITPGFSRDYVEKYLVGAG